MESRSTSSSRFSTRASLSGAYALALLTADLSGADDRDWARSCRGKVKYYDRAVADAEAKRLIKKYGEKKETYKCRHCEFLHVGKAR